jgi:hypothetical protein
MTDGTDWKVMDDHAAQMRVSEEYVVLESHWIPRILEISVNGSANDGPDPETYARVEVNEDGVPRLTELRIVSSDPGGPGIRQQDLRDVQVSALLEDFVAMFTMSLERNDTGAFVRTSIDDADFASHIRFIGRQRMAKTARSITPDLLGRVAKVYRANISGNPTKAVQHHFQVSQRMAAEYVSRARRRHLLPPTSKGKKKA